MDFEAEFWNSEESVNVTLEEVPHKELQMTRKRRTLRFGIDDNLLVSRGTWGNPEADAGANFTVTEYISIKAIALWNYSKWIPGYILSNNHILHSC